MVFPIAVTSAKRLPFMPDVPTLAEASGYPDMVFPIWYALFAPKGTPPEVVAKLTRRTEGDGGRSRSTARSSMRRATSPGTSRRRNSASC